MWNRLLSKIFGGKFKFDFSCVTGNGYITVEVLKEILREIDTSLDEYSLEQIIDEVDEDGSGTVDFDEFMAMMTGEWFFTNKSHFFNKKAQQWNPKLWILNIQLLRQKIVKNSVIKTNTYVFIHFKTKLELKCQDELYLFLTSVCFDFLMKSLM